VTRTLADHDQTDPQPDDATGTPQAGAVEGLDRLRLLLAGAMGTMLVSYALLVPAAAAVILPAGGGMTLDGAFAAAIPLWLAAHQIPIVLEGQPLSVLPMLPTVVVFAVVAIGAGWAVRRLGGRFRTDAGAVLVATAGAHAAVAVLGSALLPRAAEVAVAPWSAMVGGGLVAGAAAAVGVLRSCGVPADWADRMPGWLWPALRGAAVALTGLALVGAVVLLAGLVLSAPDVAGAYHELAPDVGSGLGVTLLAMAYLPNAVVGGLSWALGPGIAVGTAGASPFAAYAGEPSTFPLLAAVPDATPPAWAAVVLVLPVAAGALAGLTCRRGAAPGERLPAAAAATAITAVAVGFLALLAGGRLAAGPFDPVRVPPELVTPAVLLWVGVPTLLVAVIRRRRDAEQDDHGAEADAEWGEAEDEEGPVDDPAGSPDDAVDPDHDDADREEVDRSVAEDDEGDGGRADSGRPDGGPADGGRDGHVRAEAGRVDAERAEAERPGAEPADGGRAGAERAQADRAGVDGAGAERAQADGAGVDGAGAERAQADGAGVDGAGVDGAGAEGAQAGRVGAGGAGAEGAQAGRVGAGGAGAERAETEPAETEGAGAGRAARGRSDGAPPGGSAETGPDDAAGTAERRGPGAGRTSGLRAPAGSESGDDGSGIEPAAPRRVRRRRAQPPDRDGRDRASAGRAGKLRWWARSPRPEEEAGDPGHADADAPAVPEQRGPRTVGELVALRAREAAERPAGAGPADASEGRGDA
jgi:hypothetical protein